MKLNVIIIDDCAVQLTFAKMLVAQNPHLNLLGAYSNPLLALNAVNSEAVDLVLLDVEMPEIDGFSLQKLFKTSAEVIFNSTRSAFEVQAYISGALDFLQKPWSPSKIDRAVIRVLEYRRMVALEKTVASTAI